MSENNGRDTRTASQKIEDLERVVSMLYQSVSALDGAVKSLSGMQQDMVLVRDALRLLNKKTEAIVQVAKPESGITASSVSDLVIKMNVDDLKIQVEEYVKRGNLVASEVVTENSYLVCEEQDVNGNVVNPRIQFRLDSQNEDTKTALTGKKAGDVASFGEGKYGVKILETYTLVDGPAPAQAATQDQSGSDSSAQATPTMDSAPASVPAQNNPPEESPVAFGLNFHGQPEAELSNQTTQNPT